MSKKPKPAEKARPIMGPKGQFCPSPWPVFSVSFDGVGGVYTPPLPVLQLPCHVKPLAV